MLGVRFRVSNLCNCGQGRWTLDVLRMPSVVERVRQCERECAVSPGAVRCCDVVDVDPVRGVC